MIHEFQPIPGDTSHDYYEVTTQSTAERDRFLRAFPDGVPDTHEMVLEWTAPNKFRIGCRPKAVAMAAGRADSLVRRVAEIVDVKRRELMKLTQAQLREEAAKLGILEGLPGGIAKADMVSHLIATLGERGLLDPKHDALDEVDQDEEDELAGLDAGQR